MSQARSGTGADAGERIERWRHESDLDPAVEGELPSPTGLYGSSGRWLGRPCACSLRVGRFETWITDCLDTYRLSSGVNARLTNTCDAGRARCGWPEWTFAPIHRSPPSRTKPYCRTATACYVSSTIADRPAGDT